MEKLDPKKITDIGPKPIVLDIEAAQEANDNYRTTVWTGVYMQLTLMTIPVGGDIGLEQHPDTDQFLRIDAGQGKALIGPAEDQLTEQDVEDGFAVIVPAGQWHNIVNTGDEPLRLYALYSPSHHKQGIVHKTKDDAERDEELGLDEPPSWTHQPEAAK
ncbi:MAG: cupin domain-containing protein [Propionibacteriaceae bacterium]